ncbi:substrate-binding periplasmic protein [Bowmanella yangjiangensis]|uniref:Transporter substrate-binding domain-containing protein n=1 Tax=Bowmanella yangjiangensis TaxID=2811230 RepID=A0ABS3CTH6_9ALTE|nr:transporter substrate-binding domain-containing protein [Bowmanella yangjiangensis]MBN7819731.1 transporter substrate-binding domain-containing protein [Bowmanella yangjiangensis]
MNNYFLRNFISLIFVFVGLNEANAAEIKIAASLTIPPYILAESKSGMEVEIVREALLQSSHSMELSFVPLKRVYESIREGKVDAGMTLMKSDEHSDLYFSESHISYQNVAISLQKNDFKIDSVSDLKGKTVMAFQNATKYLGKEFDLVASDKSKYSEKANQDVQIAMLFSGKVDVIVLDINIFKSLRKQESRVDTSADIVVHELFPRNDMRVAFRDENLRNDFDLGLKKIKETKSYEQIISKYVE